VEEPTPDEDAMDQFTVYAFYGKLMHGFQLFELTLWLLLSRSIKEKAKSKKGDSKKVDDKVAAWDRLNLGQIIGGIKNESHWPEGMVTELERAADARNYLAHHFLREYFLVLPSEENEMRALEQLVKLSDRLDKLDTSLQMHLKTLGISVDDELDEDLRAEIDAIRPKVWLGEEEDQNSA
jgi:hypothetical protein